VVHSRDGLDEASLSDATEIAELRDHRVLRYSTSPEDFGLPRAPREALLGGDAQTNARIIEQVFQREPGPRRDIILMNAALALVAVGLAGDFRDGVERARAAIDAGTAQERLRALAKFTNRHPG
jgi:anthranilate phosphoribosyltransferase